MEKFFSVSTLSICEKNLFKTINLEAKKAMHDTTKKRIEFFLAIVIQEV